MLNYNRLAKKMQLNSTISKELRRPRYWSERRCRLLLFFSRTFCGERRFRQGFFIFFQDFLL